MTCICSQCAARATGDAIVGVGIDAALVRGLRRRIDLYRTFHSVGPSRVRIAGRSRIMPPIVLDLGELVGVMYRSDKGQPGRPRTYIHRMEDPPRLVSNAEGTQLYIVGGSYRVTHRGIEG
jgi:hypothetical protein